MPTKRIQEYWSASAKEAAKNQWNDKAREDSSQRDWLHRIEQCINDHPGTAVATALTVGVLLGWWGRRK